MVADKTAKNFRGLLYFAIPCTPIVPSPGNSPKREQYRVWMPRRVRGNLPTLECWFLL